MIKNLAKAVLWLCFYIIFSCLFLKVLTHFNNLPIFLVLGSQILLAIIVTCGALITGLGDI